MAAERSLYTVYSQAIARYERLNEDGSIANSQLALLKEHSSLSDVLAMLQNAEVMSEEHRNALDRLCRRVTPEIVSKVDRFSNVINAVIADGRRTTIPFLSNSAHPSWHVAPTGANIIWSSVLFIIIVCSSQQQL